MSTFTVGINQKIVGKCDPQLLSYSGAWHPDRLTFSGLAAHISAGHPWMPALLDKGQRRFQHFANHAEVLALDIDDGLTIASAVDHPFVKQHCGLGIESASSSPEHEKFRLAFRLAAPVAGWRNVRACNVYLAHLVGSADRACKDASRYFFGAPGRKPFLLNEAVTLPPSFEADAISWHQALEAEEQRRAEEARRVWEEWKAANPGSNEDELIRSALVTIAPDCGYNDWIAIGMALAGMGDQWLHEWDAWSAGSSSYKPGECAQKWRSFRGKRPAPEVIFGIAKRHGWRFPRQERQQRPTGTRTNPLPDSLIPADIRAQLEEEKQQRQERAERRRVLRSLERLIGGKGRGQKVEGKGFSRPQSPPEKGGALVRLEDLATPSLIVTPETLPTYEEWRRCGRPILQFQGQREAIYDRLIAYGYPDVLDTGPAGDGKSTAAGGYMRKWGHFNADAQYEVSGYSRADAASWAASEEGLPEEIRENRAVYYSANYRSPSTLELERLPEAATGGGLIYTGEILPSGAPATRRANLGETPDIEPDCIEDDNVQRLRRLGVDVRRGKNSPLCDNCQQREKCPFLQKLELQRSYPVLRSHPSLGGSGVVAFVDEATRALATEKDILITEATLEAELGRLHIDTTAAKSGIADLASVIVAGLKYAALERGFWGLTHGEILKFLPNRFELHQTITEIEDWLRRDAIAPALTDPSIDVWELPPSTVDRELRRVAGHDLSQLFSGILDTEVKTKLIEARVQPGAIRYALQAVQGYGTLEVSPSGGLKVQRPSSQQTKTLRKFRTVIGLDATPDRQTWAMQRRIKMSDTCIIKPLEVPSYENLTVRIINGVGSCGRQREAGGEYSLQSRLQLLVSELAYSAPDPARVGILDTKFHVTGYEALESSLGAVTGYNWHDNQGTNKFRGCTTLIAVNPKPLPNLTAAATIWNTRTGSSYDSAARRHWLERTGLHHLLQLIGRPRAQHTTETITINLVAENITHADVLAIASYYPGCTIERVNVADVCPEAAPRVVQVRRRLVETIGTLLREGASTSRNAVAKALNCTPSNLSQLAKPLGGWGGLVTLLESLYRGTYPPGELTAELEEQLKWVGEALPELVDQFLSGAISAEDAISGVGELLEMASGWGLWLPDRALDALHTLLIATAPDWAVPWMSATSPPPAELLAAV